MSEGYVEFAPIGCPTLAFGHPVPRLLIIQFVRLTGSFFSVGYRFQHPTDDSLSYNELDEIPGDDVLDGNSPMGLKLNRAVAQFVAAMKHKRWASEEAARFDWTNLANYVVTEYS